MNDYLLGIYAFAPDAIIEPMQPFDEPEVVAQQALREMEREGPALRPFHAVDQPLAHSRVLKSELPGVADDLWTEFVLALKTAEPAAVSASNAFGMFEMRPRRLADLGLMRNLNCTRSPTGRMVWVGEFVPPLTQRQFLNTPKIQYKAFSDSMVRYLSGIHDGTIERPEDGIEDLSLSGVLAILHRCGPSGLKTWGTGDRFPETLSLVERANGIF